MTKGKILPTTPPQITGCLQWGGQTAKVLHLLKLIQPRKDNGSFAKEVAVALSRNTFVVGIIITESSRSFIQSGRLQNIELSSSGILWDTSTRK